MVFPPVGEIIHSLKLMDYLLLQTDKPWYHYHLESLNESDIIAVKHILPCNCCHTSSKWINLASQQLHSPLCCDVVMFRCFVIVFFLAFPLFLIVLFFYQQIVKLCKVFFIAFLLLNDLQILSLKYSFYYC